MAAKPVQYELSEQADGDLEDIFDYTEEEFGQDQAVNYLLGLEILFERLVVNPKLGRTRNEIKRGLYSISYQEHIVFYRFTQNIRIVRVLHGSRDLPRFLK